MSLKLRLTIIAAAAATATTRPKWLLESATAAPSPVELTCESAAQGSVCHVYLIGTLHSTQKSRDEVRALIESVKPEVVVVELCPDRADILKYPTSEFHVANNEAMKCGAKVILGDRPIHITLERYRIMGYMWEELVSRFTLSYVKLVHIYKKKWIEKDVIGADHLAQDEMQRIFPSRYESIVNERDQYMSATLLEVARQHKSVVAVVGRDHLRGIQKNWKQPVDMKQLLDTPTRPRIVKCIRSILSNLVQ